MAVTLRLYRIGKKNYPSYRIVAVNKRYKANGKYLEEIGFYNPMVETQNLEINQERFNFWLSRGALISEGLAKLLKGKKLLKKS